MSEAPKKITGLGPLVEEVPVRIGSHKSGEIYELGPGFVNDSFQVFEFKKNHFEFLYVSAQKKIPLCPF